MVEETADKEVGVRGVHPRVKHLFFSDNRTKRVFDLVKRTDVLSGFPIENSTSVGRAVFPWLHVGSSGRYNDLGLVFAVPNWNFCVVPSAPADGPINADVVHPIQEELTITNGVERDGLNVFPHPVLNVGLSYVPFLQQNDLHWVFSTLGNGNVLVPFHGLDQPAGLVEEVNCPSTSVENGHAVQRSCDIGHGAIEVNGLERGESQFTEHGHVVLITERTDHQDARSEIGFHGWMLPNFDTGGAAMGVKRKMDLLSDEVLIALVIGVDHHHAAGTNEFGTCG